MTDLVEIIGLELVRQFEQGDLTSLTVSRSHDVNGPIVDVRIEGRLDIMALALNIKAALFDADMAKIEESIAKGGRRSEGRFKL